MKRKAPPTLMPKSKKPVSKVVSLAPSSEPQTTEAIQPVVKAKAKPKPKAKAKEEKVRFNLSIRSSIYRAIKIKAASDGITAAKYIEDLVSADQKIKS